MSQRFSAVRDVTGHRSPGGGGMVILRLAMCGHRSSTAGAKMRGTIVMLCAACNGKGQAQPLKARGA